MKMHLEFYNISPDWNTNLIKILGAIDNSIYDVDLTKNSE